MSTATIALDTTQRSGIPAAYAFRVLPTRLPGQSMPSPASFQEVSGLEHGWEVEPLTEGGENGFVHQLPSHPKARRLLLKRGLVERQSAFVAWCRRSLQDGLERPLALIDLRVELMDSGLMPLLAWNCINAYPIRWTINAFESQRNAVALEEVELAYQTLVSPS